MIKQPDQQIHDELIKRSLQLGYKTFPYLPKLGTSYPFVVMGEVYLLPRATKSYLLGDVEVTMSVWGDKSNRKLVSDMIGKLMREFRTIKRIENTDWQMVYNQSDSNISKDNSTEDTLYRGDLSLHFRFH